MSNYKVTVLGAGLAGCEAALWLAGKGVQVELYEQKPTHFSPAHKSEGFAELICSNSLKAERLDSASGLLVFSTAWRLLPALCKCGPENPASGQRPQRVHFHMP